MKNIKIIAFALMLAFLITVPGFVNADENLVTPNKSCHPDHLTTIY